MLTFSGLAAAFFLIAYLGYMMLGGIFNVTIAMLIGIGALLVFFTWFVYYLGRSRGYGLPGGKCEICGVEFASHRCLVCGRSFGHSCLPHGATSVSRCVDCNVCSICGSNDVSASCLTCGKPICSTCFSKARYTCIECLGKQVQAGKIKLKERKKPLKSKIVVLKPKIPMPQQINQLLGETIKKSLLGKEVQIGATYQAMGTEFEITAANPVSYSKIDTGTRISIVNPEDRDSMLKERQSTTVPKCWECDTLAIKQCFTCSHYTCVRHQHICPECGKVFCSECYNKEKDMCNKCAAKQS